MQRHFGSRDTKSSRQVKTGKPDRSTLAHVEQLREERGPVRAYVRIGEAFRRAQAFDVFHQPALGTKDGEPGTQVYDDGSALHFLLILPQLKSRTVGCTM
jgi:hypothetical protein